MSWKRLEDIFARRLQNIFRTFWRCLKDILLLKTSWGSLSKKSEDVLKTSWRHLEDVLKTCFARHLEGVFARRLENVWKTSWKRPEDVWPRRIYWSWSRLLEDLFWKHLSKANIFVLIKTSWRCLEDVFWRRRRMTSSRRLDSIFIKTNVC